LLPQDVVEHFQHFFVVLFEASKGRSNAVSVDQLNLLDLFVSLRQHVVWVFTQPAIELSDDLSFLEVDFIGVVKDISVAALTGCDGSHLFKEKC
jgi:hypothetical protein